MDAIYSTPEAAYAAALEHNATNPTRLVPYLDARGWHLVVNDALDLEWWRAMREATRQSHKGINKPPD
jgi:hypothetical protein